MTAAGVLGATRRTPPACSTATRSPGRPCARYYRHFHSEQGKWITGTGTKYDNNYISAVAYTELDIQYSYAQSDLCWLLDGLWMAGGGPSVGLQGAGDPNPGQGKNRLMAPDIIERWQDRVPTFHVKDLGPNDQGTQVANVGDNNGPGAADVPVRRGAVRLQPGHDAVPADLRAAAPPGAPRVPVRARRP